MPGLRDGDVAALAERRQQRLQDTPLLLERAAPGEMQLPGADRDDHPAELLELSSRVRFTSSRRNDSMRSPTFTSLKFSMPMPHSCPSRTSRTSSLKRLRLPSSPV